MGDSSPELFMETSLPELRVGGGTGDESGRGFGLESVETLGDLGPIGEGGRDLNADVLGDCGASVEGAGEDKAGLSI